MSFDPLPHPLVLALDRARDGRILDLGCGDGRLTRLLAARGSGVVGLDRLPPRAPDFPCVAGDAVRIPLRRGAWDLVVAANLLHHLSGAADSTDLWYSWFDLLAGKGDLFVLEDEPSGEPGPAGHYARLQALLAGLPGRGPLLPLERFRRLCAGSGIHIVEDGLSDNRYPLDAAAVTDLLASGAPAPGSEAAHLAEDIARDGIAPGRYWWARVERGQVS